MPKVRSRKRVVIRKGKPVVSQRVIRRANRRRKASGFEKEIYALLKEEKIPFLREKAVGRCHADIFIAPNTLIELNGCYWHGHFACQKALNKSQKAAQAKDGRRYYFFNKLGFKLEIIWECEFEKDPDAVRARLREIYEKSKAEVADVRP